MSSMVRLPIIWTSIVVLVFVLSTLVDTSKSAKYNIDDVHDFHNNQEFLAYVDEQYSRAKGNQQQLLEFYTWVRAARQELDHKLELWPTFPKNREVLRLKTREKWNRLKEYEDLSRRALAKN